VEPLNNLNLGSLHHKMKMSPHWLNINQQRRIKYGT
jgi:hypothetical protein